MEKMDIFRLGAIVNREWFSAVNLNFERLLCADQKLTVRDTPGISNDCSG
jgi:hypothetical protein